MNIDNARKENEFLQKRLFLLNNPDCQDDDNISNDNNNDEDREDIEHTIQHISFQPRE
jgi:hypothetical protein